MNGGFIHMVGSNVGVTGMSGVIVVNGIDRTREMRSC